MRSTYRKQLVVAFALIVAIVARAGELTVSEFRYSKGIYSYRFDATVGAPIDAVRRVVTDYDDLKKINDDVVESSILETYDDGSLKRRLWIKHCLLAFCFDLYFIETVEHLTENHILTTIIPEESNFKSGIAVWKLSSSSSAQTVISVTAEQEPAFWIPPVIGPFLMRRAFKKEIRETIIHIEQAALAN